MKKHWFLILLCGTSCKKLKKRCFFAFMRTLYKMSRKTRKNYMLSNTFCGTSCKTSSKKRCFFVFFFFANFVQNVSKNVKKTHVVSHFLWDVVQKAIKKRCFSHFLQKLWTKCLEKREKTQFYWHFLWERCAKSSENTVCFFAFFANFVQSVTWKTWKKITVISHFLWERRCKKLKKRMFFAFFANYVQSLLKNMKKHWNNMIKQHDKNVKKHCFLPLFVWRRRVKSFKNAVISLFLRTLYKVSRETWKKNTVFSHFLRDRRAKCSKNAVYSHFLRTLHKVPRKTWKNTVFSHFLRYVAQKARKMLFFRIFGQFRMNCLEKRGKTRFSHTFCGMSRQKLKNGVFCIFIANIVQRVLKNVKEHCFHTLFAERRAKSSKNAVFLHFWPISYELPRKTWKTLFSHTFCGTSCKKLKKRSFSHFLQTLYKVP